MVSGVPPFQAADTRRLERLILSRRPPPVIGDRCPAGLQAIVAKLLGRVPAERYDSARAIREDLERFRSGERTRAEAEGWPGRALDEEPTRRTQVQAEPDTEKTRRTHPAAAAQTPLASTGAPAASAPTTGSPASPPPRRRGRVRRLLRAAALLVAFGLIANEMAVGSDASRFAGTLPTRELEQMADAWSTYDELSGRSNLGFGTEGLDRSLIERTVVLSDRVIANYRMPSPTVREAQWRMARESLARAVSLAPRDRPLRAALRYCEGHLHRINGEARKVRRPAQDARRELTEAVTAFREAAELRPGWPDPFLGLARTFIYGLEDVDRGADALKQAQQNGYTPSERDTAQLADGYRARGNVLARHARGLAGVPQERDYLVRAADAYRQALALYPKAGTFANVPFNIRVTQRALEQVERRMDELSGPTGRAPSDGGVPSPAVKPSPVSIASQDPVPWA
jgi:hypothetical protein